MTESIVLFVQSLVVLGWVYITGLCFVLGMRWVENAGGALEAFVKFVCMVATLMVLWLFALKPTLQTVYTYLSNDNTIECVKSSKGIR